MFLITNLTLIFKHSIIYEVLVLDIRYTLSVFLLSSPNVRIISTDLATYWELQFDDNVNIAIATQAPTELCTII
jgi:hypothetical protein